MKLLRTSPEKILTIHKPDFESIFLFYSKLEQDEPLPPAVTFFCSKKGVATFYRKELQHGLHWLQRHVSQDVPRARPYPYHDNLITDLEKMRDSALAEEDLAITDFQRRLREYGTRINQLASTIGDSPYVLLEGLSQCLAQVLFSHQSDVILVQSNRDIIHLREHQAIGYNGSLRALSADFLISSVGRFTKINEQEPENVATLADRLALNNYFPPEWREKYWEPAEKKDFERSF